MSKENRNVVGQQHEEKLFNRIKCLIQDHGIENVTVFSNWDDKRKPEEQKEFDFLIVCSNTKTIIHIEAKSKNSVQGEKRKEAAVQVEKGRQFFIGQFPFEKPWKYVKAVYFNQNEERVCDSCTTFVFCGDNDRKLEKTLLLNLESVHSEKTKGE